MVSPELKITEKTSFLIALVGVIIALEPIKDDLNKINIDFGFANYSIIVPLYITFALLLLSLYVYALDYVRYGFKKLDSLTWFKNLQFIANSLYFIAILSPIIYLTTWGIVKIYRIIPILNINLPQLETFIFPLISVLISLFSTFAAWRQNKEYNQAEEEHLDESASNSMNEARQLVEKRLWNLSIVEVYRSLELSISKKLLELGIDSKKIPFFRSIDILLKHSILTVDEVNKLKYIKELRNKAVHSSVEFSSDEASDVIQTINDILPKLETVTTSGSLFEKEIFEALSGENGFFPKHHVFLQKLGQEYDIKAEGPNYNYLIEIKLTRNPTIIIRALEKLKKISSETNIRYIIVVPNVEEVIDLKDENAKVLYYDSEKHEFKNREEIYGWIYTK
jgi:HEPN domain-containing protein